MTMTTKQADVVRGTVESLEGDKLTLALPGTDYRLAIIVAREHQASLPPVGRHVSGTMYAKALRVHPASGGGQFIEPVAGSPRIVAGRVKSIDAANRRILIAAAASIWLELRPDQRMDVLTEGSLVNCYVESGTRFTPVE